MLAAGGACVRLTAARITSARRNASAYSGPRCFSHSISLGNGLDMRRQVDVLLGLAGLFAHPGEI